MVIVDCPALRVTVFPEYKIEVAGYHVKPAIAIGMLKEFKRVFPLNIFTVCGELSRSTATVRGTLFPTPLDVLEEPLIAAA